MQNRMSAPNEGLIKTQDNGNLNELKMTYIAQASLDGPGTSGTARVKDMVGLFKGLGIEIDLISYSFYSDKFKIEHKKRDPVLKTTTIHVPNKLPKFLKVFAVFPVLFYAWKSCKKCDIIFADFISVLTSLPSVLLKKIFNKPLILDYIDVATVNIIDVLHKLNYTKNADIVFAISHYLYERAKSEYGCKNVVYVSIFVDVDHFRLDLTSREKIREELSIQKDEIVIGYAGSFWNVEGVPNLLRAFKNLRKKHSKLKLAIMGKPHLGSHYDNIPKLIRDMNLEDDVILIPLQPHEEVPKFLSAFDILCCPKIDCEINRAANPAKVVEYLSMGLPTVASEIGGIIDAIDNGVNGFLVKPGDVNDLEEKLEWVILNPERLREIGENGRKKVIEKYSYEAIENTIKKTISEIKRNRNHISKRIKK